MHQHKERRGFQVEFNNLSKLRDLIAALSLSLGPLDAPNSNSVASAHVRDQGCHFVQSWTVSHRSPRQLGNSEWVDCKRVFPIRASFRERAHINLVNYKLDSLEASIEAGDDDLTGLRHQDNRGQGVANPRPSKPGRLHSFSLKHDFVFLSPRVVISSLGGAARRFRTFFFSSTFFLPLPFWPEADLILLPLNLAKQPLSKVVFSSLFSQSNALVKPSRVSATATDAHCALDKRPFTPE